MPANFAVADKVIDDRDGDLRLGRILRDAGAADFSGSSRRRFVAYASLAGAGAVFRLHPVGGSYAIGLTDDVWHSRLTPLAFLERTALVFSGRIAVVDGERRFTWAEVRERVRRLAVALQRSGIAHGDRVAFLAPNLHELLEAHFGVPRAGAVLVAVNTRLMPDEIAYILDHSGARILVAHDSLLHLVEDARVERLLVCGDGGNYEAFLDAAGDAEPEDRLAGEDDTISINYTSGTTGRPKGVMYTHRGGC
jgi:acyl-CoA synthetase (AMP-forming)/AMP-acid ligase II